MSGEKDGNAGTFYVLACPVYCGHFGGVKPPPPTVPQMRHAGPLAYSKRKAPLQRPVRHRCGEEEKATSGGGTAEDI